MTDSEAGERTGAPALDFDAWVEGRVAALLRFAYLVTGSQHAAEDAVQTALTRACERWPKVRRTTDPDAVWRVCNALPTRQRAAVVLRFYEDLEYAEIARILDVSQVTVRSQIHRALASLRVELERQEAGDD